MRSPPHGMARRPIPYRNLVVPAIVELAAFFAGTLLFGNRFRFRGAAFFLSTVVGFALLDERRQVLGNIQAIGHGGRLVVWVGFF